MTTSNDALIQEASQRLKDTVQAFNKNIAHITVGDRIGYISPHVINPSSTEGHQAVDIRSIEQPTIFYGAVKDISYAFDPFNNKSFELITIKPEHAAANAPAEMIYSDTVVEMPFHVVAQKGTRTLTNVALPMPCWLDIANAKDIDGPLAQYDAPLVHFSRYQNYITVRGSGHEGQVANIDYGLESIRSVRCIPASDGHTQF